MTAVPNYNALRADLLAGKREFGSRFGNAPCRLLKPGEPLITADCWSDVARPLIYRVRSGWACQLQKMSDGHNAIIDIYLPGDVIGIDAALSTRPIANVVALTSVTSDCIGQEDGLFSLMAENHTALYVAWLLAQRQRRTDRFLAAVSSLDARGRLAVMIVDFYRRLCRQKLVSSAGYNLPLTQSQIGSYLGLTVVHVNRVLRILRDERIVQLEKHCVTILDLERLMSLAQWRHTVRQPASTAVPGLNGSAVLDVSQPTANDSAVVLQPVNSLSADHLR
jgi:CRP-like cAMP-binding protein